MRVGVILNPVAGAGKASKAWPTFEAALQNTFGTFELERTTRPDEAVGLARKMAQSGHNLVIAAGGDGTISETVDGILSSTNAPQTALGILPCGTGSDLARTLGIDGSAEQVVQNMAASLGKIVDAGRVTFDTVSGQRLQRHFINISSLGLSGPTSRAVNQAKRSGNSSGQLVFMWHTIKELLKYRFQSVRVTVDDAAPIEANVALVAVANGRYFGGGMMIAPDADMSDGLFEVVIFRGAAKLKLIMDMRLLYSGAHTKHPLVTILRGKRILVEPVGDISKNTALLDVDGEAPGSIPALFEMLPNALKVRY